MSDGGGVAVLTGAAGGIATGCVPRIGGAGTRFLLADLSEWGLDEAAHALSAEGWDVHTALCDVSDESDVRALAERASSLGRIDRLVHTAGVAPPGADDPRRILEVNLLGTIHVLDAFEALIGEGGVGICIASLAGHRRFARDFDRLLADPADPAFVEQATAAASARDSPALAAYALSKRGVIAQCERRAAAWGARGARIMSVSPGLIDDTAIGRAAVAATQAGAYAKQSAIGRAGSADDVAAVVGFLCSEGASYLSGDDILVDGGVLAYMDWHAEQQAREAWHQLRS